MKLNREIIQNELDEHEDHYSDLKTIARQRFFDAMDDMENWSVAISNPSGTSGSSSVFQSNGAMHHMFHMYSYGKDRSLTVTYANNNGYKSVQFSVKKHVVHNIHYTENVNGSISTQEDEEVKEKFYSDPYWIKFNDLITHINEQQQILKLTAELKNKKNEIVQLAEALGVESEIEVDPEEIKRGIAGGSGSGTIVNTAQAGVISVSYPNVQFPPVGTMMLDSRTFETKVSTGHSWVLVGKGDEPKERLQFIPEEFTLRASPFDAIREMFRDFINLFKRKL